MIDFGWLGLPRLDTVHVCKAEELLAALPDNSVDMILTDIPYGVINHNGRIREREQYISPMRTMYKADADTIAFDLEMILREMDRVTRRFIYIFCGTEQAGIIRAFYSNKYMTRHCIWEKTNPTPLLCEYMWLSSIENCIVIRKPNAPFNEFYKSSVWRFPGGDSEGHATRKPVELFSYLIAASSKSGDVILDPFVGSGTTAVAAANTGRHFICGDISAEYVEIARRRLSTEFGRPAPKRTREIAPLEELPLFSIDQP